MNTWIVLETLAAFGEHDNHTCTFTNTHMARNVLELDAIIQLDAVFIFCLVGDRSLVHVTSWTDRFEHTDAFIFDVAGRAAARIPRRVSPCLEKRNKSSREV